MKLSNKNNILRFLMILTVIAMVFGMTGAAPQSVSAMEASYIVQSASTDLAATLVTSHGGVITSRLEIINAVAANLSKDEVAQLRNEAGIVAITSNGEVTASDNNSDDERNSTNPAQPQSAFSTDYPELVGADVVWDKGFTGNGITVAVLDTGISGELPQLSTGINGRDGRIIGWEDYIDRSNQSPVDPNGHGSHVAGIIANSEVGADGNWNGIAPGVNLVGVRVLNEVGAGTYESVINGLQWVFQNQERYHIRVVNLSLVSKVQSPYWADPLNQAVTAVWGRGITVVTAAGNTGPDGLTIAVPGNNPYVITVGAFTDNFTPSDWSDDYLAPFSSVGPTLDGFVKPDVVAPGGHIVSVVPNNSYLATEYPANVLGGNYFKLAGTSMSAAVVSGIAALVLDRNESLSPDQIKYRITNNAMPWLESPDQASYSMFEQGSGRVSAPDSVFSISRDAANQGLNFWEDLAGSHSQGYAYWDEDRSEFRLKDQYDKWDDGYATMPGKAGAWSGKAGAWSGKAGAWSGKAGAWSGKAGAWSGKAGAWSGTFGSWTGKAGAWSGKAGAWSGKAGAWSGLNGSWAGKAGAWSGKAGAWSGKAGAWSGKAGAWSGKAGAWSGGYGTWAGKAGAWSGSTPWAGTFLADPAFIQNFEAGVMPDVTTSSVDINQYLLEP